MNLKNKKADLLEALAIVLPLAPAPLYFMNEEGRVLALNDECLRAMGATREMVINKTSYDFYPQHTAELILNHNQEVMRTGQILSQEERIEDITTGKTKYFASIKTPLFDEEGKAIGILGTSLDITDRKKAEEEKEQFVKTVMQVAHYIRSPLMIIDLLAGETSHSQKASV